MRNQLMSAMTGLTAKKPTAKPVAKISATDLTNALQYGQTAINAALHLATALHTSRKANVVTRAKASAPAKKSKPARQSTALSGRGWQPAEITDAPDVFQGTGDTVDD